MSNPPHLSSSACDAAWALVVELRTGLPQFRGALVRGDARGAGRCLDVLTAKAGTSAAYLQVGWPRLAEQVSSLTQALRHDGDDAVAWDALQALADELEDALVPGWDVPVGWHI